MAQVSTTSCCQIIRIKVKMCYKWSEMVSWRRLCSFFFFVACQTHRFCLWCGSRRCRYSATLAWTQCCRASARPPPAPALTAPRPPWSPRSAWHSGRAKTKQNNKSEISWCCWISGLQKQKISYKCIVMWQCLWLCKHQLSQTERHCETSAVMTKWLFLCTLE